MKTSQDIDKERYEEIYRNVSSMEPMLPESGRSRLSELTVEIFFEAGALAGGHIPPQVAEAIRGVVQNMNSYYSNLIEGHKTSPREVERALRQNYDHDPKEKSMQQLGVAHIEAEQAILRRLQEEPELNVYASEFLTSIHYEFYSRLPDELRVVKDSSGREYSLCPGEMRTYNVDIASHVPPDFSCLNDYMSRFHECYGSGRIIETRRLVAIAASHHRLLWIHPFGDGNGRVARLFSHAALAKSRLDGYGLWTLTRGLARHRDDYYRFLALADLPRRNDYDGRGNLSDKSLGQFCEFFLETILDQIKFMNSVLDYPRLKERIENYIYRNNIFGKHNDKGKHLLFEALREGEYGRGEATRLTGYKETSARELLQTALEKELLVSDGPRSPVRLGFPSDVLEDYFPKLYMPAV